MPKAKPKTRSSVSTWSKHPLLVTIAGAVIGAIITAWLAYPVIVVTKDPPAAQRRLVAPGPMEKTAAQNQAAASPAAEQLPSPVPEDGPPNAPIPRSGPEIPNCYAVAGLQARTPSPIREVFVFVDQTTQWDRDLAEEARRNLRALLRPAGGFVIATFSATEAGRYPRIVGVGITQAPPADRRSLSMVRLRRLDACLAQQARLGSRLAIAFLDRALGARLDSVSQSEIMDGLKQLSARVAVSTARERVVLILSDMIEHSDIASFYQAGGLRLIDPLTELRIVHRHQLRGTFGGARIYVMGAGFSFPPARGRDVRRLNALQAFWAEWFRLSNGRLVAFGRPSLVVPVDWSDSGRASSRPATDGGP